MEIMGVMEDGPDESSCILTSILSSWPQITLTQVELPKLKDRNANTKKIWGR